LKEYNRDNTFKKFNPHSMVVDSLAMLQTRLVGALEFSYKQQSAKFVLIGGCSRAGKSYLAKLIKKFLEESLVETVIVELDAWLLSKNKRKSDSSVLERYEINNIVTSVIGLLDGNPIYPPVYDTVKRERIKENQDSPMQIKNGVIILEGVVALAVPELLKRASFRIFVDISDALRRERMAEFYLDYKKMLESEFHSIMDEREREEVPFVKSTRYNADVVFSHSKDNGK
jgi:uridine kinase